MNYSSKAILVLLFYTFTSIANAVVPCSINKITSIGSTVYLGTEKEGLWISNDDGKTWAVKTQADGLPSSRYSDIYPINTIFADGSNIYIAGQCLHVSRDSGLTWNKVMPNNHCLDVTDMFKDNGILYASTSNRGIIISKDGGYNWISTKQTSNAIIANSVAVIGSKIYAGNDYYGLYVSNDNGKSWDRTATGYVNSHISSLVVSGSNIYVGSSNSTGAPTLTGLTISRDNGTTWEEPTAFSSDYFHGVSTIAVSGKNIYVGNAYGLFYSADNGLTWTRKLSAYINSIAVSGSNVYAADSTANLGHARGSSLYISRDMGGSWVGESCQLD